MVNTMEYIDSTIPAGMTLVEWRRQQPPPPCGFCRSAIGELHKMFCIRKSAKTPVVR